MEYIGTVSGAEGGSSGDVLGGELEGSALVESIGSEYVTEAGASKGVSEGSFERILRVIIW